MFFAGKPGSNRETRRLLEPGLPAKAPVLSPQGLQGKYKIRC
jgi:hypothetical protein